jgi:hypothetical protein
MKSKYSLVSIALAAASLLFGPGDASAGGGSWWGRVGYNRLRVTELRACIDDYSLELRVAFRAPGAASIRGYCGVDVGAMLFGSALCDDHRGNDGWYSGWQEEGGYLGYGPRAQGLYSGYSKYDDSDVVLINGFRTYRQIADREPGNWFFADFDLIGLQRSACLGGYVEDVYIEEATVFINGRPFYLDEYDLELCGDAWYDGWEDSYFEGWDD